MTVSLVAGNTLVMVLGTGRLRRRLHQHWPPAITPPAPSLAESTSAERSSDSGPALRRKP